MPFKSEAQRRYLWANEPEIARDWTDTYGSRIQKSNGGIMDVASDGELIDRFKNYKKGKQVTVPTSFQARAHSTPVNLAYITDEEAGILKALKPGVPHDGPMHIPNYNDYDPDRGFRSGAAMSAAESGKHTSDTLAAGMSNQELQDIRSGAIAAGAGQVVNPRFFGPKNRVSKEELARAKAFAPGAYRATRGSPFGIGNLMGGMFAGWPGAISSFLSKFNLRGYNPDGTPRTQAEYEENRRKNQIRNQIDRLKKTRDFGKYANDPEGWAASTLSSRLAGLEQDVFGKDYVDHSRNVLKARDALGIDTLEPDMVKEYRLADYIDVNPSLTQFGGSPRMNYIAPRPINTNIEPDDPFRAFNYTTIA